MATLTAASAGGDEAPTGYLHDPTVQRGAMGLNTHPHAGSAYPGTQPMSMRQSGLPGSNWPRNRPPNDSNLLDDNIAPHSGGLSHQQQSANPGAGLPDAADKRNPLHRLTGPRPTGHVKPMPKHDEKRLDHNLLNPNTPARPSLSRKSTPTPSPSTSPASSPANSRLPALGNEDTPQAATNMRAHRQPVHPTLPKQQQQHSSPAQFAKAGLTRPPPAALNAADPANLKSRRPSIREREPTRKTPGHGQTPPPPARKPPHQAEHVRDEQRHADAPGVGGKSNEKPVTDERKGLSNPASEEPAKGSRGMKRGTNDKTNIKSGPSNAKDGRVTEPEEQATGKDTSSHSRMPGATQPVGRHKGTSALTPSHTSQHNRSMPAK